MLTVAPGPVAGSRAQGGQRLGDYGGGLHLEVNGRGGVPVLHQPLAAGAARKVGVTLVVHHCYLRVLLWLCNRNNDQ